MKNDHASQTLAVAESEAALNLHAPLDRRLVWLMAVASALSIANLYYIQFLFLFTAPLCYTNKYL